MNFFQQLFDITDGVDVTITVKRKNDKLTLSILPTAIKDITPAVITGTPEALETDFFEAIKQPLEDGKSVLLNVEQYKESLKTAEEEMKEEVDEKQPKKAATSKSSSKKSKKSAPAKAKKAVPKKQTADSEYTDENVSEDTEVETSNREAPAPPVEPEQPKQQSLIL